MPKIINGKKVDEKKWAEAKAQAKKENKEKNYAYIVSIYKKMIYENYINERDSELSRYLEMIESKKIDYSDLHYKMEKYMPDDPKIQDEFYQIINDNNVDDLIDFINDNADDSIYDYMPKNGSIKGFANYIMRKAYEYK